MMCTKCKAYIDDYWKFVKMGKMNSDSNAHYGSDDFVDIHYEFDCPYCSHNVRIVRKFKLMEEVVED